MVQIIGANLATQTEVAVLVLGSSTQHSVPE